MKKSLAFRYDINILRGIAVILVVLYHYFPGLVPGGFIGVDVFFVISGYLMTSIIMKSIHNNAFSFTVFFKSRFKRIVPSLTLSCSFIILIAWFVTSSIDYKNVIDSSLWSIIFLSNIFYWKSAGDYFAADVLVTTTLSQYHYVFDKYRLSENQIVYSKLQKPNVLEKQCTKSKNGIMNDCKFGDVAGKLGALVLGDSHAISLVEQIGNVASVHGKYIISRAITNCNTAEGLYIRVSPNKVNKECGELVKNTLEDLGDKFSNIPIIINRTSQHIEGRNELSSDKIPSAFIENEYNSRSEEYKNEIMTGLIDTACKIAKTNPVYVTRPTPEMGVNVPRTMPYV
ncbi:hypothetical protein BCS93_08840 [Vibrio breoganii]|uniref:Acyltransferase n=1 Tax=Vibrio breoganii TaxID=553239 RepID=A0AAP8MX33_9VIBR|nr:acyltransferase family protein [Vibrio breoganii]PMP11308.1 hypothetical protein BCS93_08840 [Vibrio breoganii]